MAWADATYRLIDQSTGTLTGDLKFENSGSIQNLPRTIDELDFTYYARLNGYKSAVTGTNGQFLNMVGYDIQTTQTTIKIYVYNNNNGQKSFYVSEIKEGETSEIHKKQIDIPSKTTQVITINTTNTTNSSVFFYANTTDFHIYQIEITESGEHIHMAGEDGYSLIMKNGRANIGNGSSAVVESIDNMEIVGKNTCAPTNSTVIIKTTGTDYVKFTAPQKVKMTVTFASTNTGQTRGFYVSTALGVKTGNLYLQATTPVEIELQPGTYYLNPNGADVTFGSIAFTAIASAIAPPTNFDISDAGLVSFDAVDGADRYELKVFEGSDELFSQAVNPSGTILNRPFKRGSTLTAKLVAYSGLESSDPVTTTWSLSDISVADADLPVSEYCGYELINQDDNAASKIGMTWETDEDGNINIYAVGVGAAWRNTGFKGVDKFKVADLPASLYFTEEYTTGSTVYTLKLKPGKTVAKGEQITFHENAQWQINGTGNYYRNYKFTYTYGANCPTSGLATPTALAIDADNVLTFTGDEAATGYTAIIYYNEQMIHSLAVEPTGTTLPRPMLTGATYSVSVIAAGEGGTASDESAKISWVLADAPATAEGSEYCSEQIQMAANASSAATMSWQTEDGNIVITIDGENNTTWRDIAFGNNLNAFSVGMVPASEFFDVAYATGSTTYVLQKKNDKTIVEGETINYKGSIRWKNNLATNAYLENQTLSYTYGSICVSLSAPVITDIDAEGHITFVGDELAESYMLTVTLNGLGVHSQAIVNGEEINYIPRLTGDYKVTLVAKADGLSDSPVSEEYTWSLEAVDYVPTASEVCVYALNDGIAYLSISTEDDDVVFTIKGDAGTAFRNGVNTFDMSGFMVGTASAANYFTAELVNGNTYRLALKPGVALGQGSPITYHGNIRWLTSENTDAYMLGQTLAFTYGNVCTDNAPALTASGKMASCSSVELTMQAVDDHATELTYTISREGASDITITAANNVEKKQTIDGLEANVEYTFSITVSDGFNVSEPQIVNATPVCDTEDPVITSFEAVATDVDNIKITALATDNFEGTLSYTVYVDGAAVIENALAASGEEVVWNIGGLNAGQSYAISIVVTDAAGHSAASDELSVSALSLEDNILFHKLATAGAVEGGNIPASAIDNNETSYWGNYNKVSYADHNNWFMVDLCGTYDIDRVTINWKHFPDYGNVYLQSRMEEDSEWTTIYTHSGAKPVAGTAQIIDFAEPVTADYLRVFSEGTTNTWFMAIHELKAYGSGHVALRDALDNTDRIEAMDGLTADVAINRSFSVGTGWFTLVLPFDLDEEQVAASLGECELAVMVGAELRGSLFHLDFAKTATVQAGVPFLYLPAATVNEPLFKGVTIKKELHNLSFDGGHVQMIGLYGPSALFGAQHHHFLAADNYLYEATLLNPEGTPIKGFRDYFVFAESLPAGVRARVRFVAETATGLEPVDAAAGRVEKIVENGRVVILKDGAMYNVCGIKLK